MLNMKYRVRQDLHRINLWILYGSHNKQKFSSYRTEAFYKHMVNFP